MKVVPPMQAKRLADTAFDQIAIGGAFKGLFGYRYGKMQSFFSALRTKTVFEQEWVGKMCVALSEQEFNLFSGFQP